MATIYGLHDEILSTILTLLVTSSNGAADLVKFSSTCHRFLDLARQSFVLKVVNFQNISMEDHKKHRQENDLLFLCARAGNLAAESRLGKAILHNDVFFLNMTLKHDAPLSNQNADTNGVLIRHRLVRAFIRHASDAEFDTIETCLDLLLYMALELGQDAYLSSRMSSAISEMSVYHSQKTWEQHILSLLDPLDPAHSNILRLKPETGVRLRENLLAAYDEMFYLSHE